MKDDLGLSPADLSADLPEKSPNCLREILTDAIRYWELRRMFIAVLSLGQQMRPFLPRNRQ